jgi:hypothetical protein
MNLHAQIQEKQVATAFAKTLRTRNFGTYGFWVRHQDGDMVVTLAVDVDALHVRDWYNCAGQEAVQGSEPFDDSNRP